MAGKSNITFETLDCWDQYRNKAPDEVLSCAYARIEKTSRQMCGWYWASIRIKRVTSLWVRGIAFALLVVGTTFPLLAALQDTAERKLFFTQIAVGLLVVAGLIQLADKVFGWSSGWMRYITTVTTMENLTRAFQLEWARYLVSKASAPDAADAKALFELAKGLEHELTKLQAEETTKWVAEFNTGIALLDNLIKTQREETDRKLEAIRTSLTNEETAAKAQERAQLAGALEVALNFKADSRPVRIGLDSQPLTEFLGTVWTKVDIHPGRHVLRVVTTSDPPRSIERIAEIKPDSVAKIDVTVPVDG
jgi:hypothetical protein